MLRNLGASQHESGSLSLLPCTSAGQTADAMDLESLLILLPATGGVTPGALDCALLQALANRHGLITGASGTGKTLTCRGCGSCAG